MAWQNQSLNQIARQANWLEINGNIPGSDRLRVLLEQHNCCFQCGQVLTMTPKGGNQSHGEWICPSCDNHLTPFEVQ